MSNSGLLVSESCVNSTKVMQYCGTIISRIMTSVPLIIVPARDMMFSTVWEHTVPRPRLFAGDIEPVRQAS